MLIKISLSLLLVFLSTGCNLLAKDKEPEANMTSISSNEKKVVVEDDCPLVYETIKSFDTKMIDSIDKIRYQTSSGSVAPQYHRIYVTTITKDNIEKSIYSNYGSVKITEANKPISHEEFQSIKQTIAKSSITRCKLLVETKVWCIQSWYIASMATGCSSSSFAFFHKDTKLLSGYTECNNGNLCGNTDKLVNQIHSLSKGIDINALRDFYSPDGVTFYFKSDRYTLDEYSLVELHKKIQKIKESLRNQTIKIIGHTNQKGTDEYNFALGFKRARAIKEEFLKAGIPVSNITTHSYGEADLICSENTSKCNEKNRRVVLRMH